VNNLHNTTLISNAAKLYNEDNMDESESPGLFVGDEPSHDSDDNISLTSTVPEADQIEYKVEKILCEGERPDGEPVWLGSSSLNRSVRNKSPNSSQSIGLVIL